MDGDKPLVPALMETIAKSYVVQILAKEKTLDDGPAKPEALKPRVAYLVEVNSTQISGEL
jgi:hypothetical protein